MSVRVNPKCVADIIHRRNHLAIRFAQEVDAINKNAEIIASELMELVQSPEVKHFLRQMGVLQNLMMYGRWNHKLHPYQMGQFQSLEQVFDEFKKLAEQWAEIIKVELVMNGERVEFTFTPVM